MSFECRPTLRQHGGDAIDVLHTRFDALLDFVLIHGWRFLVSLKMHLKEQHNLKLQKQITLLMLLHHNEIFPI